MGTGFPFPYATGCTLVGPQRASPIANAMKKARGKLAPFSPGSDRPAGFYNV
jgi:hypothetical protein